MSGHHEAYADWVATLAENGLPPPPIPAELARRLVRRGRFDWSTIPNIREERAAPYDLERYVASVHASPSEDLATVMHCGHGSNSWALVFYLLRGPLQLFIHLKFGGAYEDRDACAARIAEAFEHAEELVTVFERATFEPGARVFVVACDFYGSWWSKGPLPSREAWKRDAAMATLREALEFGRGLESA